MAGNYIYLEIVGVGKAMRVAAVDAVTGEEVVFQVPEKTSRVEIERLAIAKLRWKQDKDAKKKRPGSKPGRGIQV